MKKHMQSVMLAGYEITEDGKVLSHSNWRGLGRRELAQDLNDDGYPSVRIVLNGKRIRYSVHRLVAMTFLSDRPSDKHEVRHLDGNKLNAHASNLAWGTRKENADDRERHGTTSRGDAHGIAIKKSSHREKVKRGHEHYKSRAAIAKATGSKS